MKTLIRLILISITFIWNSTTLAGSWISNPTIQYLYAGEVGGRYTVKVSGSQPNPDSCRQSFGLMIEENNSKLKEQNH